MTRRLVLPPADAVYGPRLAHLLRAPVVRGLDWLLVIAGGAAAFTTAAVRVARRIDAHEARRIVLDGGDG